MQTKTKTPTRIGLLHRTSERCDKTRQMSMLMKPPEGVQTAQLRQEDNHPGHAYRRRVLHNEMRTLHREPDFA